MEDWRTDVRVSEQVRIESCGRGEKTERRERALVDSTSAKKRWKSETREPERWGR